MGSGFIDQFLNGVADFQEGIAELTNSLPQGYCILNTADTETTLVSNSGALVTVIRLDGSLSMVGLSEYNEIIETLTTSLEPYMEDKAHQLQVVFDYDPSKASQEVSQSLSPAFATAERLGLDLTDFLTNWSDSVADYCSSELCYLVLWTLPNALSQAAKSEDNKIMRESYKNSIRGDHIQNSGYVPKHLHEVHNSYISAVESGLRNLELMYELLDNHVTLHGIRSMLFPSLTGPDWKASLPGDEIPLTAPEPVKGKDDMSMFGHPLIGDQLFPDSTEDDGSLIIIDEKYHAPLLMSLAPQTPKPFNALFRSLIRKGDAPWRMSFLIDSGGSLVFKSAMSAILSFGSSNNKRINKAVEELEHNKINGGTNVRLRVSMDTWADDRESAIKNRSDFAGAIQSWGSSDVSTVSGDPLLGVSATLPAFMMSSPGVGSMPPLEEALNLLPLTRPSSPWLKGNLPMRSPDGKVMAYAQMSAEQNAWIDIGIAPMGFGKSVWLNTQNLAFCLQAGLSSLPYLSILDIGPSSKGLIKLLQAALPADQTHLAAYHRLRMEKEYAINPFDLPLGTEYPSPSHDSFLVNFVCLLCTPLTESAPSDSIPGLARAAIKAAYEEFAPKNNPKVWVQGIDATIDELVDSLAMHVDGLTWCKIRDELFDKGDFYHASRAQRYAVPMLSDVASMARRDIVSGIYKGEASNKESITDYFWRSCIDAISAYPILAAPTAFDTGEAKIVALDLDEVAPKGGPDADRQTGIMYMLGRHVVGAKLFRMPADVKAMPEKYKAYHFDQISRIREQPKRIAYDEFHRVSRNSSISKQIISDIETAVRESRKWLLSIGLYSQSIDDYPEVLVDLASSFFILGVGNEREARKVVDTFGLGKPAISAIAKLRKPNKAGATMLVYHKTDKGDSEQLLTNTLGAQGIWAFSTTTEDSRVRDLLYDQIGVSKTLHRLSKAYPGGVKAPLAAVMRQASDRGEAPPDGGLEWIEALGLNSLKWDEVK